MQTDNFHGDFMVKLVWYCLGFTWRKHGKSNYQTISIKSVILPNISIIATYYGDEIFFQWKHYENKRNYVRFHSCNHFMVHMFTIFRYSNYLLYSH